MTGPSSPSSAQAHSVPRDVAAVDPSLGDAAPTRSHPGATSANAKGSLSLDISRSLQARAQVLEAGPQALPPALYSSGEGAASRDSDQDKAEDWFYTLPAEGRERRWL